MNFAELKKLIKEIKDNVPCQDCKAKFKDRDISLIGTVLNEGYLQAKCSACKNNTIINVVFGTSKRQHRKIAKPQATKIITSNDILDMQNFLKDFDGNFIKLFNKK